MQRVRAPTGLHLAYVARAEHPAHWDDVLGIATFNGTPAAAAGAAGIPIAQVNTPVLPPETHLYEVWSSGQAGRVRATPPRALPAHRGDAVRLHHPRRGGLRSARPRRPPRLHAATAQAYAEICATLEAQQYPHLLRVWNYLPDINRDSQGTERYRQFNSARQCALQACGRAQSGSVPAASALGATSDSPVVVYFLAGRSAPVFVENPRQVSAYHYPRQYGTHSPLFSRAALLRQTQSLTLFVSGTASIVGHRSLHIGNTARQTRETLTNIEALLSEANRVARGAHFELDGLAYKVYVRRPEDLALIQSELAAALGSQAQVIYLQADICRQDLLVEIEATGICPLAAAA